MSNVQDHAQAFDGHSMKPYLELLASFQPRYMRRYTILQCPALAYAGMSWTALREESKSRRGFRVADLLLRLRKGTSSQEFVAPCKAVRTLVEHDMTIRYIRSHGQTKSRFRNK